VRSVHTGVREWCAHAEKLATYIQLTSAPERKAVPIVVAWLEGAAQRHYYTNYDRLMEQARKEGRNYISWEQLKTLLYDRFYRFSDAVTARAELDAFTQGANTVCSP